MFLFGFDAIAHEVLEYKIYAKDVDDAAKKAKAMGLIFPEELWYKAISVSNDGLVDGRCVRVKDLIKIEALSDGTWCPQGTPFAQVSNTVKGFGDIVTWWEGRLIHAWFPSACATRAWEMRNYLDRSPRT